LKTEYFENGNVKCTYRVINNKKEGKYEEFYEAGQKHYVKYFKSGLLNGKSVEYYENGKIKRIGHFNMNKPSGWFYYYNVLNKLDSIQEYILLNSDSIESFFSPQHESSDRKDIYLNRYIIYDKNQKPLKDKSACFQACLNKINLSIGDTLKAYIDFCNKTNNRNNKFRVYIKQDNVLLMITPELYKSIVSYEIKVQKKGENYLQGYIEEYLTYPTDTNYFFFKYRYIVR
jgi:hypothetical protein